MKRILAITKGIINYIFAMIFAVIFALFLDANVGWFILIALLLAPLLSVFFAWLSARTLSVSCEMDEVLLSKGDTCRMDITVTNHSIFPTPPIEMILTQAPGLPCKDSKILVSVISRASQQFPVTFTARISGPWQAGVESIRVTDYLGLFSFAVQKIPPDSLLRTVPIIPNIAEISARDDQLVKAMQMSLHADDGDDTIEAPAFAFGGFPGYDSREYIPGDPLKRINWKQSAKKDKLLVRLDDEMAAQSISVVLDSCFDKDALDLAECATYSRYHDLEEKAILPKIAEDAVENALGMIYVLVRHSYTVQFYARMGQDFIRYEIQDENDLENVRLELSRYRFSEEDINRFPQETISEKGASVSLYSTPNTLGSVHAVLQGITDILYTTIYSVPEEAKKQKASVTSLSAEKPTVIQYEPTSLLQKGLKVIAPLIIPYLLAFLLSTSFFAIFDVPFLSPWTIAQAIVIGLMFVVCEFVRKHKIIGGMLITVLLVFLLMSAARIVFSGSYGLTYMYWFLSGGDSVETTASYLLSLLMVFTVFFAIVVYYFIRNLYRTSFLMLVSLMPFIVHVKVMQDINMVYVVLITALNVAAFLLHTRMERDSGKRQVGRLAGLISVGLYALIFVCIGLAVPKEEETRYYYVFENLFLGGNVSTSLPEQFSGMSEFSGNADGFNELNDRKLYELDSVNLGPLVYLRRQTFDCYDFEKDHWYSLEEYATPADNSGYWSMYHSDLDLSVLAKAMHTAEELSPGFLEKYGLEDISKDFSQVSDTMTITATNFPSAGYLTPTRMQNLKVGEKTADQILENTVVTKHGIFQADDGYLNNDLSYEVTYYEQFSSLYSWVHSGGSDFTPEESLAMLEELNRILTTHQASREGTVSMSDEDYEHLISTVYCYITDYKNAIAYREACMANTALIPESVRNLALEITKDCTYDWEKANALQLYFERNGFVYDLSYKAPDDSVEYFLFKGKTGTCSDYASAYVLMARSVGLTARYVEGFVPEMEYGGQYLIRTNNGHAYPEVFIENVGFVVYEATKPAVTRQTGTSHGSGITTFLMTMGIRIVLILALVSLVIITLLFLHRIAAPFIRESYFKHRLKKATPSQAMTMIYKRLIDKHSGREIKNARSLTPYEYGCRFEAEFGYDLSEFIFMLENCVYEEKTLNEANTARAMALYNAARVAILETRKEKRKNKHEIKTATA